MRWILAIVMGCFAFLILREIFFPRYISKTNRTVTALTAVRLDFSPDDPDARRLISRLSPRVDKLTLNSQIAAFLLARTNNYMPVNRLVSKDGLLVDDWGTPLRLLLTNDPAIGKVNPRIRNGGNPFLLWSAGPNKKDELGYGDDVFLIW